MCMPNYAHFYFLVKIASITYASGGLMLLIASLVEYHYSQNIDNVTHIHTYHLLVVPPHTALSKYYQYVAY